MTKEELSQIIANVSLEWLYNKQDFVCYWDINSGSCGDFAFAVKKYLPGDSEVTLTTTGDFLEEKGIESYGENGDFSNHVWLTFDGYHFDIERQDGVSNFMDLPYFQREIKKNEMSIDDHKLYFLINENPTEYKNFIADSKFIWDY